MLYRDFRQLTNVLILSAMMIIFPLIRGREQNDLLFGEYMPFFLIILFSAMASIQLTSRLIPFEGKSFWVMKILPQSWIKMLVGKFLVGFGFNLASVWLAVLISVIYFHSPLHIAILAFILTFFTSFGISIWGLSISSLFPKFDWDHPKRMLSAGGSLLLFVGALLFLIIMGGIILILYFLLFSSDLT